MGSLKVVTISLLTAIFPDSGRVRRMSDPREVTPPATAP